MLENQIPCFLFLCSFVKVKLFFFSVSNHFFFCDNFVAVNQVVAFCKALFFPEGVSGFVVAEHNQSDFCNSMFFQRVNRAGKKFRCDSALRT